MNKGRQLYEIYFIDATIICNVIFVYIYTGRLYMPIYMMRYIYIISYIYYDMHISLSFRRERERERERERAERHVETRDER